MDAYADKLLKHFQKKPAPKMKNPGKFDHGGDGNWSAAASLASS